MTVFRFQSLWIVLLAPVFLGCSTTGSIGTEPLYSQAGTTTTFILVRHAERDDNNAESYLTPKGQQRANDLVTAIGDKSVSAIYSPNRGRNIETVTPLADHVGVPVQLVPTERMGNTRRFADEFARESLVKHSGGVIVWVGNRSPVGAWGGNLKEIFQRLGGKGKGPSRYSDLYFITVSDNGPAQITATHYGAQAGKFDQ